jgi:cold shock CspA family protein
MNGTVKNVNGQKGYGFIRENGGKEYFFHRSDFNGFFDDLVHDWEEKRTIHVTFEIVPSPKGLRAANVTREDGGV